MTAIEIPDELAQQIVRGAEQAGETHDVFLRQAVLSRMEDLDDIALATERLRVPGETISLEELKRNLGLDRRFERDLTALDSSIQRRIISYLEHRIATADDPKQYGAALSHDLAGHWKYRVGDYRVICRFEEQNLLIVAVAVGHRSIVYDR